MTGKVDFTPESSYYAPTKPDGGKQAVDSRGNPMKKTILDDSGKVRCVPMTQEDLDKRTGLILRTLGIPVAGAAGDTFALTMTQLEIIGGRGAYLRGQK